MPPITTSASSLIASSSSNSNPGDDMKHQHQQPAPKERRFKLSRACDRCRRRRIKCDEGHPCQSCLAANSACTFEEPGKRSHPHKSKRASTLEDRMHHLESLIQGIPFTLFNGNQQQQQQQQQASLPTAPLPQQQPLQQLQQDPSSPHTSLLSTPHSFPLGVPPPSLSTIPLINPSTHFPSPPPQNHPHTHQPSHPVTLNTLNGSNALHPLHPLHTFNGLPLNAIIGPNGLPLSPADLDGYHTHPQAHVDSANAAYYDVNGYPQTGSASQAPGFSAPYAYYINTYLASSTSKLLNDGNRREERDGVGGGSMSPSYLYFDDEGNTRWQGETSGLPLLGLLAERELMPRGSSSSNNGPGTHEGGDESGSVSPSANGNGSINGNQSSTPTQPHPHPQSQRHNSNSTNWIKTEDSTNIILSTSPSSTANRTSQAPSTTPPPSTPHPSTSPSTAQNTNTNTNTKNTQQDQNWFPDRTPLQTKTNPETLWRLITNQIPPSLMDSLVQCFLSTSHYLLPFLHVPTFLSDYQNPLKWGDPGFASLIVSICCLSSRHIDDVRVRKDPNDGFSAGTQWFELFAKLRTLPTADTPTLYTVQSVFLAAVYAVGLGKLSKALALLAESITLSVDAGLHRTTSAYDIFSPITLEIRKRTFWCIYIWDKQASAAFGRPPMIRLRDCDVEEPTPVDDEFITEDTLGPQPQGTESRIGAFVRCVRVFVVLESVLDFPAGVGYVVNSNNGNEESRFLARAVSVLGMGRVFGSAGYSSGGGGGGGGCYRRVPNIPIQSNYPFPPPHPPQPPPIPLPLPLQSEEHLLNELVSTLPPYWAHTVETMSCDNVIRVTQAERIHCLEQFVRMLIHRRRFSIGLAGRSAGVGVGVGASANNVGGGRGNMGANGIANANASANISSMPENLSSTQAPTSASNPNPNPTPTSASNNSNNNNNNNNTTTVLPEMEQSDMEREAMMKCHACAVQLVHAHTQVAAKGLMTYYGVHVIHQLSQAGRSLIAVLLNCKTEDLQPLIPPSLEALRSCVALLRRFSGRYICGLRQGELIEEFCRLTRIPLDAPIRQEPLHFRPPWIRPVRKKTPSSGPRGASVTGNISGTGTGTGGGTGSGNSNPNESPQGSPAGSSPANTADLMYDVPSPDPNTNTNSGNVNVNVNLAHGHGGQFSPTLLGHNANGSGNGGGRFSMEGVIPNSSSPSNNGNAYTFDGGINLDLLQSTNNNSINTQFNNFNLLGGLGGLGGLGLGLDDTSSPSSSSAAFMSMLQEGNFDLTTSFLQGDLVGGMGGMSGMSGMGSMDANMNMGGMGMGGMSGMGGMGSMNMNMNMDIGDGGGGGGQNYQTHISPEQMTRTGSYDSPDQQSMMGVVSSP